MAFVREHCTPSFINLGTLNGGEKSIAYGRCSDGFVIVGMANDGTAQDQESAFHWT